jgi:ABC-type multidrug transport system fused ATPase/permease subunit
MPPWRVFTWHIHGNYLLYLSRARVEFYLPVRPSGGEGYGGQRQRLALARALLAKPTVLLLDDCTSALDAETENRVRAALKDLLPGRTRLIVSHKAASLRDADWVVVLENGRIVEQGRPADVLVADGLYAAAHSDNSLLEVSGQSGIG